MSKKTYSPLSASELLSNFQEREARRQKSNQPAQLSEVASRRQADTPSFSMEQLEIYKKVHGENNINYAEVSKIKYGQDLLDKEEAEKVERKVKDIPHTEFRDKKRETLAAHEKEKKEQKIEASLPPIYHEIKAEQSLDEDALNHYKESLKKRQNLQMQGTREQAQLGIATAAASQAGTTSAFAAEMIGGLFHTIAEMIPDEWGIDETKQKELKKVKSDIYTYESPVVERKLKVAQDEAKYIDELLAQELNKEDVDRWKVTQLNTAKMVKEREIEQHTEYLGDAGFWEKFENHKFNIATIGIVDLVEKAVIILPTALKGQDDPDSLDEADKLLLKSYQDEINAQSSYSANANAMQRLGDGLGHSGSFLMGMMVTRGASGAAGNMAKRAVQNSVRTTAAKIIGGVAQVATQSAMMPMTYTETAKNMVGVIEYDADNNKILMNEQIYEDFKQKIDGPGGEREKLGEFVKSLNARINLDGYNPPPELMKQYQDARARLGLDSTSSLKSFDELLKETEKAYPERMSAGKAFQRGYGASVAEVIAETYMAKGFGALSAKLLPRLATSRVGQLYLRGEREFAKVFDPKKATGGLLGNPVEEFAEEVFVTPLHMLNEWSLEPGKEWYDPEKGLNTKHVLDVALQTIVMGGAFGALGKGRDFASYISDPKAYRKQKADRKAAVDLFRSLKYAGSQEEIDNLLDSSSLTLADVENKKKLITALRATGTEKDNKKADLIEKSLFSKMVEDGVRTGTLENLEAAMYRLSMNPDADAQTKLAATRARDMVSRLRSEQDKYSGMLNQKTMMQRAFIAIQGEENIRGFQSEMDKNREAAEKEWNEIREGNPEFEDISLDDITSDTKIDQEIAEKIKTAIESGNYHALINQMQFSVFKDTAQELVNTNVEANRKESTKEFQHTLKGKAHFTQNVNKALNSILRKAKKKDKTTKVSQEHVDEAIKTAEKKIPKRYKKVQLTQQDKTSISQQIYQQQQLIDLIEEQQNKERVVKEEKEKKEQNKDKPKVEKPETPETPEVQEKPEIDPEDDQELKNLANQGAKAINEAATIVVNDGGKSLYDPQETPEGVLDDLDFPDEMPADPVYLAQKKAVAQFYEKYEEVFGRTPTFREMIEQLVKYNGPKTMETLFPGYAEGWEANNYRKADFKEVFDEFFRPLERLAIDSAANMADIMGKKIESIEDQRAAAHEQATRAEKEIKEEEDKTALAVDSNNEPVLGNKKAKGYKTTNPEAKMGFNAVEYETVVDEATGSTERVAKNTNKLKDSNLVDVRELIHPDKFLPGDEAAVSMYPDTEWDKIPVSIGIDENNEVITTSFANWVAQRKDKYEQEHPGEKFEDSQDFINKVPIAIMGSQGQPVAMVHDTDWYNHVTVGGQLGLTPDQAAEDAEAIKLIKEGRQNTQTIRNKILREGKNVIKVTKKTPGPYNKIPDNERAITVEEANPQAIFLVQQGNKLSSTRNVKFEDGILLNKDEDFNKLDDEGKLRHNGHLWVAYRVGTQDGKPTYRAHLVLRTTDDTEFGIKKENVETMRWVYAAWARLNNHKKMENQKVSQYEEFVQNTDYAMSLEEAERIRNEIYELTELDIAGNHKASDIIKMLGGIQGNNRTLLAYGKILYEAGTTEKTFRQNTDLTYLNTGFKMFQIKNGEIKPQGTYSEYLAKQATTNVRALNIGTPEDPVYVSHPQPSIYYEVKDESLDTVPAPEVQNKVGTIQQPAKKTTEVKEEKKEDTQEKKEEKNEDEKKIDDFLGNVRSLLINDLQIGFDDTITDIDEEMEDDLPGNLEDMSHLENILDLTENLTVKQEGQIVEYLFTKLLQSIDAKKGTKVSVGELEAKLQDSYEESVEAHLAETESAIEQVETILRAYPEHKEAKKHLLNLKRALSLYDSIYENWDSIQSKAIAKVVKYTDIKETEEDNTQEEDTAEREGNWSASSLQENAKAKTSYELKRFMAGIPLLDENGDQKKGFLGVPLYLSFDEVYNKISQFYAGNIDVPSDYHEMIKLLQPAAESTPWVNAFIKKLQNADDQLRNQFMNNYVRHSLSMKFAMYDKTRDNDIKLGAYDTNANEVSRIVIDQWKQNMNLGGLIKNGELDVNAAIELKNKYDSWGNNKHMIKEEDLRDFLDTFGINLSNQTWEEIKAGRFYNGRFVDFQGMFTDNAGLFRLLAEELNTVINRSDSDLNLDLNPEHHPFNNLTNVLKALAKIESKFTTNGITLTFRDGGKLINSQVPPKFATDRISDLKRKETGIHLVNQLLSLPIAKQNTFLKLLRDNPDFRDKFGVSHLGLQAFKEMGKKGNPNFTGINDLNEIDHDYVKLTFLQDVNQGSLKTTTGIPMRMAKLFFPTMSDKDQMLLLSTAVFDFVHATDALFDNAKGDTPTFALGTKKMLFNKLVTPELSRIIDFYTRVKATNIKGYDDAAKMFNFIPALNNVKDKEGMRAIERIAHMASEGMKAEEIQESIEKEFGKQFQDAVEEFVHHEAQNKKKEWEGNILESTNGEYTHVGFNQGYKDAMGKLSPNEQVNVGVYDMVINSLIGNQDMFTGIAGDPALYAKDMKLDKPVYRQADSFYADSMEAFGTNIGKRLALLLAPGVKIANSRAKGSNSYKQLFLKDTEEVSENIGYLINLFYGEKAYNDEVKSQLADIDKHRKVLQKKFPKIADYFNIESTDAQEYTTISEHLDILNRQGKLKPEEYQELKTVINNNSPIPKELYGKVFQPIKPVYTGQLIENGVGRMVYIKTSSFPLIKELTSGTNLDKLRQKMEEIEKKHGVGVRASYESGNKVGSVKDPIDILNDDSLSNAEERMLTLNRDNFRIQQDVPFKSDKKGRDTVSMGTQIFKLLMGDGIREQDNFVFKGETVDGKRLTEIFNDTFGNLVKTKKAELYHDLGLDANAKPKDKKYTAHKLQELLKEEAIKRNYPLQDVKNLNIEEKDIDGTKYYEFVTPLWLSTNSVRFESMLNAIVTNRLLKHKMPGWSGVAASEHGMGFVEDLSEIEDHRSRIIYLDGWNGKELQGTSHKLVDGSMKFTKAQVFAPSKFKNSKGELVDLFEGYDESTGKGKYIFKKDGRIRLRKGMIDQEMLNMFSFRTPTSSHVSGSSIEIVGFLPPESGDMMMVPKNFTKQKGLDYDVDKETNYMLNHVVKGNGKIEVLSEKHKKKALAPLEAKKAEKKGPEDISAEEAEEMIDNLMEELDYTAEEAYEFVKGKASIQEKIDVISRAYDKKIHENDFIRLHLSVYNNPSDVVQKKINQILSMDFAGEQAKMFEKLANDKNDNKHFSILSDSYQRKKMDLGAAGKLAIGVYSNFVTSHGLIQQNGNPMYVMNPETSKPVSFTFGNTHLRQMTFGNEKTLDGSRTIAEVFAEKQNTATDNEKEQILGRVGVNGMTINVDAYMTTLGFDKETFKDENNEDVTVSLPYALLSQPIIKDYVKMMQEGRGITSPYTADLKKKVIQKLINKYKDEGESFVMSEIGQMKNLDFKPMLTAKNMVNAIKADKPNKEVQLGALQAFLELDMRAKQYAGSIGLVNTNDLGLSMMETTHTRNKLSDFGVHKNRYLPGSASIKNIEKLIGEFAGTQPKGEDAGEYVKIGGRWIKPTTAQGHLLVHGVQAGSELWADYFPYSDGTVQGIISQIHQIANIDLEKNHKVNEENQSIVADLKKYMFSIKGNGIFTQRASEERQRLFIDNENNTSLAVYMMELLKAGGSHAEILKANKLINKFTYEPNFDGRPSLIKFNNVDKSTFDEDYLYNALTEMILENKKLPDFNGQSYSTKQLAQDLITYAYVEGGTQQAIQFIKYVPIEYLKGLRVLKSKVVRNDKGEPVKDEKDQIIKEMVSMPVNEVLQSFNANRNPAIFRNTFGDVYPINENTTSEELMPFVIQYFQHHPEKLPQVKFKERMGRPKYDKAGKEVVAFSYKLNENEELKDVPQMVSVKIPSKSKKKQDKWAVYRKVNATDFVRIDALGIHGMNEYEFKSPKTRGIAKSVIGPAPTANVQKKLQAKVDGKAALPFNIKEGESVMSIIDKLGNANLEKYPHLVSMAQYLKAFVNPETKVIFDESMGATGSHKSIEDGKNISVLKLNPNYMTNPDMAAKVFFHEFIHSVTKWELQKYFQVDGRTIRRTEDGNQMNLPLHIQNLNKVFHEFRKQYDPKELAEFSELEKQRRQDRKKGIVSKVQYNDYQRTELYAANNVFEFVTIMMTEPTVMDKMGKVPYKATKDSIFKRFGKAVKALLDAIHPDGNNKPSITSEGILATLEVIKHQKKNYYADAYQNENYAMEALGDLPIPDEYDHATLTKGFGDSQPMPPGIDMPPADLYKDEGDFISRSQDSLDPTEDGEPSLPGGILDNIDQQSDEDSVDLFPISISDDVQSTYYSNPDYASIGSIEDYNAYLQSVFPDTKVPQILYHGSNNKIEEFSREKLGKNTNSPSASQGFYFTNVKSNAMHYTLQQHGAALLMETKAEFGRDNEMYYNEVYLPVLHAFNAAFDERSKIEKELKGLEKENAHKKIWEKLVEELKAIAARLSGGNFKSTKQLMNELNQELENLSFANQKAKLDEVAKVMKEKNMRMVNYDAALKTIRPEQIEDLFKTIKSKPGTYTVQDAEGNSVPSSEMRIYPVMLNVENPLEYDDEGDRGGASYFDRIKKKDDSNDAVIFKNSNDPYPADIYVMFNPKDIHILGSKNDIANFKEYVNKSTFTDNDIDNLPDCI